MEIEGYLGFQAFGGLETGVSVTACPPVVGGHGEQRFNVGRLLHGNGKGHVAGVCQLKRSSLGGQIAAGVVEVRVVVDQLLAKR